MPDLPLSQSPRTQGFQVQPSPEDEDELFAKGFTDLAYKAFNKQNPELMADVVTFRPLDTDATEGLGVGAFILKHGQDIFYVPVVVSDNAIKPLDLFYARRQDHYYPLTREWLDEAAKSQVSQMGSGVSPPKTLQTDVDIRNLVVPPTTGRYSYAEAHPSDDELWTCFRSALEKTGHVDRPLLFPQFVSRLPTRYKVATQLFLRNNRALAAKFAEVYGVKTLAGALAAQPQEKTAEVRIQVPLKHDVFVASALSSPAYLKAELGPTDAKAAYQSIRLHGFYVKDRRPETKDAFRYAEETLNLVEPTTPGVYRVFLADDSVETVVVVPNPVRIQERQGDETIIRRGYYHDDRNRQLDGHKGHFLVLFDDGRHALLSRLLAEPLLSASHANVTEWLMKASVAKPSNGQEGCLVCTASLTIRATEPFGASKVRETHGITTLEAGWGMAISLNPGLKGNTIIQPQNSKSLVVSGNFRWVECKTYLSAADFLTSPSLIFARTERALEKQGAERVVVRRAGEGFVVARDGKVRDLLGTVKQAAERYGISVPAAMSAIEHSLHGHHDVWAVARPKTAAGETLGDPNDPNNPPVQDPAAQQGPPPGPSGIELAVAEQMQLVQQQMAALQQQMQMLTQLQQRAQGIDQGGGAMAAPAAAAGMQGGPQQTVNGQPAMAPAPEQGAPPPDQGQAQQGAPPPDPSQQGAPPPDQGGGAPPPDQGGGGAPPLEAGPPQPGGAMPPQPAPPPPPPPPPPVMSEEPTPENIQQQINPQFLQEAGKLMQDDVFDAAAIASLAQNRSPRDLVQSFLPALDRSLDNLGRVLLLYYVKETDIKKQIGMEQYQQTEQILRDVTKGMGEAVLRISREADQMRPFDNRTM